MEDQQDIVNHLAHVLKSLVIAAIRADEAHVNVGSQYLNEVGYDIQQILQKVCRHFDMPFPGPPDGDPTIEMCQDHSTLHRLDPDNPVNYNEG